jgi:hypothetical protein
MNDSSAVYSRVTPWERLISFSPCGSPHGSVGEIAPPSCRKVFRKITRRVLPTYDLLSFLRAHSIAVVSPWQAQFNVDCEPSAIDCASTFFFEIGQHLL